MDVILAGFNIDRETLNDLESGASAAERLTPETISAAYARISRNPRSVTELREVARRDVEKARRSNRTIVFDMGHSSIAEHAVFNIDVLGVSRLAVEFIEQFRLASYTEKSQRYIRLDGDFVIPAEVSDAGLSGLFTETVSAQNALYHDTYRAVLDLLVGKEPAPPDEARKGLLEGSAKEDARYILSLATETQLGMTVNARTLELMIRRAAAHPLSEVNEYGRRLAAAAVPVAPSLIRYTEATSFDRDTAADLAQAVEAISANMPQSTGSETPENPARDGTALLHATPDGDDHITAAIVQGVTGGSYDGCLALTRRLSQADRDGIIRTACARMHSYDAPLREFELADLTFEIIMSASCFAQMKRHRMATILSRGGYDPALGATLPATVEEAGMTTPFRNMIDRTNDAYERLRSRAPAAAAAILTNAHRRRVIIKTTVRELYHISRLREDRHAQWDIREQAGKMVELGRAVMPRALMFACGKDRFDDVKRTEGGTKHRLQSSTRRDYSR